jgi:hypothetical protein
LGYTKKHEGCTKSREERINVSIFPPKRTTFTEKFANVEKVFVPLRLIKRYIFMQDNTFDAGSLIHYWTTSSDDDYDDINARDDDLKMSFQKKCTPDFTAYWINQLTEKRLWIKGLIM